MAKYQARGLRNRITHYQTRINLYVEAEIAETIKRLAGERGLSQWIREAIKGHLSRVSK